MVVTDDDSLANLLRIIRNQGQEGRYNHTWLGHNYRMTDVLAAIGIEQLKRIDFILDEKVKLSEFYTNKFSNIDGVEAPHVPSYVDRPSWYMYSIKLNEEVRDSLIKHLANKNIDTRLSFPPVHLQQYYSKKYRYKPDDFPVAWNSYKTFLDIPIWVGMDDSIQEYIVTTISSFIAKEK